MLQKIRLVLLFYRSFAFLSNLATAFSITMILKVDVRNLSAGLFLKCVILGLAYFIKREYGDKKMYYFNNGGLSPRLLWSASISLDMFIFLVCIIITFSFL